jgi:hypothetical protein
MGLRDGLDALPMNGDAGDWQRRLNWNLAQIASLRKKNDKAALARRNKKDRKAREALIAIGSTLDLNELKAQLGIAIHETSINPMEKHNLDHGDICEVTSGKFAGKRVLVIKAGIQTKFGLKAITVEYVDKGDVMAGEKIWCSPEQLAFAGEQDLDTAGAVKEADYQEWKARKQAGVPPASAFKRADKPWATKKRPSDGESDDNF